MTSSEEEKLMEGNVKAAIDVGTKHDNTRIAEGTIEDALKVLYDEQEGGINTIIRNMVEGILIDIFEQARIGIILARNVDALAKSNCFMDALTRFFVEVKSSSRPIAAFVEGHIDKMVEEVLFIRQ